MRLEPHPVTTDASREVVELLVEAFRRAIRLDQPTVGTEHLLFALLKGESAAKDLLAPRARVSGPLMGVIAAKGVEHWESEDGVNDTAATPADDLTVTALLREADWTARRMAERRGKPPLSAGQRPLPTEALVAAIGQALLRAHELGVSRANATHLLMGLVHDPGNRASEALLERRLDRDELISRLAVHPSAHQDGTPHADSVNGLRNVGVLTQRGRMFWGGLARALSSGSFGSPVLPMVRREARRQAVRLGHPSVATVHLLLAMLALDDQLTTTGHRLRDELVRSNTGADLLRTRGVTLRAAVNAAADLIPVDQRRPGPPAPSEEPGVEQALTRARLDSHERNDPTTGTTHLLTALLADSDDLGTTLLAAIGVDTDELRRALGH
jgi:ATP-dependent Clp protease ATP-binding subunit ClpA